MSNLKKNIEKRDDQSKIVLLIPIQLSSPESIHKDTETPKCEFICGLDKRLEMRIVSLRIQLKQNKFDDTMYKKFWNDFINLEKNLIK